MAEISHSRAESDSRTLTPHSLLSSAVPFREDRVPLEAFEEVARGIEDVLCITMPDLDKVLFVNEAYEAVGKRSTRALTCNAHEWLGPIHEPDTGLGLPICKRIVGPHGARSWVESKQGEGSVFQSTLPKSGTVSAPERT